MAHETPAHDARTVRDLADACEAAVARLEAEPAAAGLAPGRRAAAAELRALADGASAPAKGGSAGEGLLDKARDMLGALVGREASSAGPGGVHGGGQGGGPGDGRGGGLDALEAEEARLQARFEAALADDRLSGPVRDGVLRAYDRVKPAHDAVRQAALAARGEA